MIKILGISCYMSANRIKDIVGRNMTDVRDLLDKLHGLSVELRWDKADTRFKYRGDVNEGTPEGEGTMTWRDGSNYRG